MGLIQNVFEQSGITTISISLKPEVSQFMNIPRGATIRFPYGYPVGPAFDPKLQREILTKGLELIYEIEKPGTIVKLSYRWSGSKSRDKNASADPRTQELMDNLDNMLSMLQGIQADMIAYQQDENSKEEPNAYKLNFYKSQEQRAAKLALMLEDEALFLVKGLRNLSGPIKYLREQ